MIPGTLPGFPRLLNRVWRATDPASRCERRCDALDRPTPHQRLHTVRGDYWVCAETGQMSRETPPEDLPAHYDAIWQKRIAAGAETEGDRRVYGRWMTRIAPYRQAGRLLEVGCGLGGFLRVARAAGWAAEANELSSVAARVAREASGAKVIVGPLEEAALESGVYDVILCNNVFEHLRKPRLVLGKLASALRPGGVMFFETLGAQSLSLWFQPTNWFYYGEGHLFIPTRVSLAHYFQAAGLQPVRYETHGFHSGAGRPSEEPLPRRILDKCLAHVAARLHRGHRVRYLLRREP